jgi:choline-sulfatase
MLRHGRWKYIHHIDKPAQLFDLALDPEELHDRAADPACAPALAGCLARLRAVLDPHEVDRRAKTRQAGLLALAGGREAALARGDLGYTPAPGTEATFD